MEQDVINPQPVDPEHRAAILAALESVRQGIEESLKADQAEATTEDASRWAMRTLIPLTDAIVNIEWARGQLTRIATEAYALRSINEDLGVSAATVSRWAKDAQAQPFPPESPVFVDRRQKYWSVQLWQLRQFLLPRVGASVADSFISAIAQRDLATTTDIEDLMTRITDESFPPPQYDSIRESLPMKPPPQRGMRRKDQWRG